MKIFGIFLAGTTAAFLLVFGMMTTFSVSPQEERLFREKSGCVPTNEFVGRHAERLWLCASGIKYPESSFYYLAYQEKRAARGW